MAKKRTTTKKKKADTKARKKRQPPPTYPIELKLAVVAKVLEEGWEEAEVADTYGLSKTTVTTWRRRYEAGGVDGLLPKKRGQSGRKPTTRQQTDPRRRAVIEAKQARPSAGTRRIRDLIARFEGLGISETTVRRILHEEGLIEAAPAARARGPKAPRRFERARPNQMWQSDIFTFLLRRHERVYLAGFMDDHSRFIVGWALAHHQKSSLVIEALERGLGRFGRPREILTDNGRQYTAWRGKTAFEGLLRNEGITHIKSRPQHPMTLGKIERFWKTAWDEFLSQTVFADYADLERRLGLFIDAYNFQRPHQGIGGLVPADRFFEAAPQVRAAVEQTITDNSLRLARQQPPRKPFYLVGRLGDRDLSIAATDVGVRVRVGDEDPQTIDVRAEEPHEPQVPNRIRQYPYETQAQTQVHETQEEVETHAQDDRELGQGRHRQAAHGHDPGRPQWPDAGIGRDRAGLDLAGDVLPARVEGPDGDARCADPGRVEDRTFAELGQGFDDGGGQDRAAGEGQAAPRTALVDDDAGAGGADEEGAGPQTQDELDALERLLGELLGEHDGEEEADETHDQPTRNFDPDSEWRGRALKWERKLTGANAPSEDPNDGTPQAIDQDELEEDDLEWLTPSLDVPDAAEAAGVAGATGRGRQPGDEPADHGDRGRQAASYLAGADAKSQEPRADGGRGGDDAAQGWPAAERRSPAAGGRDRDPGVAQRGAQGRAFEDDGGAGRRAGHQPGADLEDPWARTQDPGPLVPSLPPETQER